MTEWFQSLAPRERWLVSAGAVICVLLGFLTFVWDPLVERHTRASSAIERKLELLSNAARIAPNSAGSSDPAADRGSQSLTLIVANTANANGLGTAYRSSSPTGNEGIRVNLENASFDALVAWLGQLASVHGLAVTQARITDRSEAGRVDVSLVLARGS